MKSEKYIKILDLLVIIDVLYAQYLIITEIKNTYEFFIFETILMLTTFAYFQGWFNFLPYKNTKG